MREKKTGTMKNFEKYKDYLVKAIALCNSDKLLKLAGIDLTEAYAANYYESKKSLVDWLLQDYKEPILEEDERKYLSDVIRPFRNKVEYIAKFKSACSENEQYIHILFYEGHYLSFPYFKANSMYKGMKLNKAYTLKELGL